MIATEYKIEALKLARAAIVKCGECDAFVCNALDFVAAGQSHLAHTCAELKKYIESVLPPKNVFSPTLEDWQYGNGYPNGSRSQKQRMQDRLDWVDWMIACLEGFEPFIPGAQPVANDAIVRVKLRNGETRKREAELIRWFAWREHGLSADQTPDDVEESHQHDVIAYRVIA
ncbi:MAG: hypothetical protein VB138_15325 [Burkholderia sp.]